MTMVIRKILLVREIREPVRAHIKIQNSIRNMLLRFPRIKRFYACFNGGWTNARNLEEYLNLIVKLSKPQKNTQYRFYLNCKNEIVAGKTVEEVLSKEEYLYSKSENAHEQFWRVVTNSHYEF